MGKVFLYSSTPLIFSFQFGVPVLAGHDPVTPLSATCERSAQVEGGGGSRMDGASRHAGTREARSRDGPRGEGRGATGVKGRTPPTGVKGRTPHTGVKGRTDVAEVDDEEAAGLHGGDGRPPRRLHVVRELDLPPPPPVPLSLLICRPPPQRLRT